MLVILQFGSRAGEVVDFLPHEARAMLADGRARPVVDDDAPAFVPSVERRTDRVAPNAKRRRHR